MGVLRVGWLTLTGATFELTRTTEGIELTGMVETGLSFEQGSVAARAWRDDLIAYQTSGEVVPVVWDGLAAEISGFYRITSVEFQTKTGYGNYGFTLSLAYAVVDGFSADDLKFESRKTGGVLVNDHSVTLAASEPIHAPPPHTGYDQRDGAVPITMIRNTADGYALTVYRDVDPNADATFNAEPDTWLGAACRLERVI